MIFYLFDKVDEGDHGAADGRCKDHMYPDHQKDEEKRPSDGSTLVGGEAEESPK